MVPRLLKTPLYLQILVGEGAFFRSFVYTKENMTKKLWQTTGNTDAVIEKYTVGQDYLFDNQLAEYDIYGSLAHAKMLGHQKIIDEIDVSNIETGLKKLLIEFQNEKFQVCATDEDVHTKVEVELTKLYPESGAKLHIGRSRNDQVLVDTRLYAKQKIFLLALEVLSLAESFIDQAKKYQKMPLVGMTHMQPAMLSSFGLWFGAFAESLIDDCAVLKNAFSLVDQSPLGSGAGYGVSLPIDREHTAELLGFSKVQNNALYCQNSRGKIEATIVHSLSQVMATLNKFASDCLLYTTEPFAFITFAKELGTGSSIMPQKQNWDALELMRSKYHQVLSVQQQMNTTSANLSSGYNRDVQLLKGGLLSSFEITMQSVEVAKLFLKSIAIHETKVLKHIPKEVFAAHWAFVLTREKQLAFRDAYRFVKENIDSIPSFNIQEVLAETISQGSPGNLNLAVAKEKIRLERTYWRKQIKYYQNKIQKLLEK